MADMPNKPLPQLNPATNEPIGPEALTPIFPMGLIQQEVSTEKFIEIPDQVRDIYKIWRPSPLIRATQFEKALDTPAKIYYKYEGVSPAGSHKPNTAIAQAYYNKQEGIKMITTEYCAVFMVKLSFDHKPYRKIMINTWGGTVHASPSTLTEAGRSILAKDPNSPGSLGMAISEAIERAVHEETTKYSLGSVLSHVLLHQTVIG